MIATDVGAGTRIIKEFCKPTERKVWCVMTRQGQMNDCWREKRENENESGAKRGSEAEGGKEEEVKKETGHGEIAEREIRVPEWAVQMCRYTRPVGTSLADLFRASHLRLSHFHQQLTHFHCGCRAI